MRPPATPLLRAVAAHGIPDTVLSPPAGPLPDDEWAALLDRAGRLRVVGLLAAAVADGAMDVTTAQFDQLARVHAATMERILEVEAAAVRTVALLEDAGVAVRVLKGLAAAHLDLPDPSQREFGDVDLLVPPGAFAQAADVLAAAGLRRDLPERRAGFDARFGKDATLTGPDGIEIDLHRTLALGAFGTALAPDSLWDDGEGFRIGPLPVVALAPATRLLHASYSAVLGDKVPRLAALRDVAQLAMRSDVPPDVVVRLAEAARGGAVVAHAVRLAGATLGTGPSWALWEWAGARPETGWERAALACYESQGGSNTSTLLGGTFGLRTTAGRLAYVSALLLPDRRYVQARRDAGRPAERARAVRELLARPRARPGPQ